MGDTTLKTVLVDIPADKQDKRGWKVEVNGAVIAEVSRVSVSNPKFGILEYANDPAGFDRWGFHESGGGGAVIVPYVFWEKNIFIGLVEQNRVNQGGKVLNVPRGFIKPGEAHFTAAKREAGEELGATLAPSVEVLPLDGEPANPNSAFFETFGNSPDGAPEGVKFYAIKFPPDAFEGTGREPVLKPGFLTANPELATKKLAEQILGSRFLHWPRALQVSDMFSVAGVGRLLAHLHDHP